MKDKAYAVVADFNGKEQLWRAGLFDSPEEAEEQWCVAWDNNDEGFEFLRVIEVVLE